MKNFLSAITLAAIALCCVPSAVKAQTALSSITAATAANTINSGSNEQTWEWNALTNTPGLVLSSNSTTSLNNQSVISIIDSGANSTSNVKTIAGGAANQHSGTGSINFGFTAGAVNGSQNYGLYATEGSGAVSAAVGDTAVWGDALDTSGTTVAVYGTNKSSGGYAGYFDNTGGGYAAAFLGGNVGIGTATPQWEVEVDGTSPFLSLNATTAGKQAGILFYDTGTQLWNIGSNFNDAGDQDFYIHRAGGSGNILIADTNGGSKVGIGNNSPSYLLHVGSSGASGSIAEFQNSSGDCVFTPSASTLGISCASDARLKTGIKDSGSALSWLAGLHIRDFAMKSTGERGTGVVAQEVGETNPEMVHMGPNGYYKVDGPNPWKLVKAIQELKAENEGQQSEIEELRQEIARLKTGNAM